MEVRARTFVALTVLRVGLGLVFVVAGGLKLFDPGGSVAAVASYRLFPGWAEQILGRALPPIEVAIGLMLIAGLWTRLAAIAASVFLVGFLVAMGSAWARDLPISCGCFGSVTEGDGIGAFEIGRDLLFLATAGIVIWKARLGWGMDRWLRQA